MLNVIFYSSPRHNMMISRKGDKIMVQGEMCEVQVDDIQDVLLDIGIPSSLLGFMYITYAEQLVLSDPSYMRKITNGLYKEIAKKYDSTPTRVERCIRHAIEVGCTQGNTDSIYRLFKHSVNPLKGTPTNGQFIARVYYHLANR